MCNITKYVRRGTSATEIICDPQRVVRGLADSMIHIITHQLESLVEEIARFTGTSYLPNGWLLGNIDQGAYKVETDLLYRFFHVRDLEHVPTMHELRQRYWSATGDDIHFSELCAFDRYRLELQWMTELQGAPSAPPSPTNPECYEHALSHRFGIQMHEESDTDSSTTTDLINRIAVSPMTVPARDYYESDSWRPSSLPSYAYSICDPRGWLNSVQVVTTTIRQWFSSPPTRLRGGGDPEPWTPDKPMVLVAFVNESRDKENFLMTDVCIPVRQALHRKAIQTYTVDGGLRSLIQSEQCDVQSNVMKRDRMAIVTNSQWSAAANMGTPTPFSRPPFNQYTLPSSGDMIDKVSQVLPEWSEAELIVMVMARSIPTVKDRLKLADTPFKTSPFLYTQPYSDEPRRATSAIQVAMMGIPAMAMAMNIKTRLILFAIPRISVPRFAIASPTYITLVSELTHHTTRTVMKHLCEAAITKRSTPRLLEWAAQKLYQHSVVFPPEFSELVNALDTTPMKVENTSEDTLKLMSITDPPVINDDVQWQVHSLHEIGLIAACHSNQQSAWSSRIRAAVTLYNSEDTESDTDLSRLIRVAAQISMLTHALSSYAHGILRLEQRPGPQLRILTGTGVLVLLRCARPPPVGQRSPIEFVRTTTLLSSEVVDVIPAMLSQAESANRRIPYDFDVTMSQPDAEPADTTTSTAATPSAVVREGTSYANVVSPEAPAADEATRVYENYGLLEAPTGEGMTSEHEDHNPSEVPTAEKATLEHEDRSSEHEDHSSDAEEPIMEENEDDTHVPTSSGTNDRAPQTEAAQIPQADEVEPSWIAEAEADLQST